jgi:hypothetical protein
MLEPSGARRAEYAGSFGRRQAYGGLNARQAILPEAQQVLIGRASNEERRRCIGGITLGIGGVVGRGGAAMRLVPKQQHLVKRRGNVLEYAAERRGQQTVPIIGALRGPMGGRPMRGRRKLRGHGNPG